MAACLLNVRLALRRANVPIVQMENIAAAGLLQRIACFSEADALGWYLVLAFLSSLLECQYVVVNLEI